MFLTTRIIADTERPHWNSISPEITAPPMTESTLNSIFTSQDGHQTRLGWISFATGITYCGICLGSAVEPRVGESCECCGAQVISVFDAANGKEAIRRAWNEAGVATVLPELATLAI
jgi:peptide methionine sulfoxide reductase MsrB